MSDIGSLRAELARQERINAELRSDLWELESGVSSAHSRLNEFQNKTNNTLSGSTQRMISSHNRIVEAYEIQGEIDHLYERFKQVELANKKIRACNNKKYYEFANYRTVRKLVQGIMDNMDMNMVSDEVIYKSVEKQHLQTPDYWLTCVLISIMAWKNDDRELAERAMARAISLDKKDSAIFYMLFHLRLGREETALKWFYLYQECDLKGSDEQTFLLLFSLMTKTLDDFVDDHTKYEIYSFINKVIAMSARSAGFSEEEIIRQIENYLIAMKDTDNLQLNLLKRCMDDYGEIAETVILAENNKTILQFLMDVRSVTEIERNAYISKFIDDVIAKPNQTEQEVYDEIEYNECIIRCDGYVDKAKEMYLKEQERRKKELNLIKEMVRRVYESSGEEVNGQVKKNMFVLTGGLQRKAISRYAEDYRSRVTDVHPVSLGEYRTTADFRDQAGEQRKIEEYYETQKAEQLAEVKDWPAFVGFALAVACAAGAAFVSLMLLAGTALGLIFGFVRLLMNSRQRKQIASDCAVNISSKTDLLDRLFAEYEQLKTIFYEYDAYQEQIAAELGKF